MPNPQSKSPGMSWQERVLDRIKPQPAPPHAPTPPPVDRTNWEHSVDVHRVKTLTVHDVGLIVFQEMKSHADSDRANESLSSAREKVAHAVINADNKYGRKRERLAGTAPAVEPTAREWQNPHNRAAHDSSIEAARNAYLRLDDPTHGATHFRFRPTPDRSNFTFQGGTREGLPLKTQSGPFVNSFLKGDVHSRQV